MSCSSSTYGCTIQSGFPAKVTKFTTPGKQTLLLRQTFQQSDLFWPTSLIRSLENQWNSVKAGISSNVAEHRHAEHSLSETLVAVDPTT